MSSAPIAPVPEAAQPPEPNFWIATPQPLPTGVGLNRVNWDLRADDPPAFSHSFEINANPGLTPPSPEGPLVPPGVYTVRLTVAGKTSTQPLTVINDPRSPATAQDVRGQYALQTKLVAGMRLSWDGYQQVAALRALVAADTAIPAAKSFDSTLAAVGGNPDARGGGFGGVGGGAGPAATFVPGDRHLRHHVAHPLEAARGAARDIVAPPPQQPIQSRPGRSRALLERRPQRRRTERGDGHARARQLARQPLRKRQHERLARVIRRHPWAPGLVRHD